MNAYLWLGHATAVGVARGDRTAVQLLQIRQRIADHVPAIVHSPAAEQSRTLLQLDVDTCQVTEPAAA